MMRDRIGEELDIKVVLGFCKVSVEREVCMDSRGEDSVERERMNRRDAFGGNRSKI